MSTLAGTGEPQSLKPAIAITPDHRKSKDRYLQFRDAAMKIPNMILGFQRHLLPAYVHMDQVPLLRWWEVTGNGIVPEHVTGLRLIVLLKEILIGEK